MDVFVATGGINRSKEDNMYPGYVKVSLLHPSKGDASNTFEGGGVEDDCCCCCCILESEEYVSLRRVSANCFSCEVIIVDGFVGSKS